MAASKYALHVGRKIRRDGIMSRDDYLLNATTHAKRGQELPQTKLLDLDVVAIKSAVRQRENLRKHIKDNLSNDALAKTFNVHIRTIEKITQCHTWSHIV